jgi:hypothetical protein
MSISSHWALAHIGDVEVAQPAVEARPPRIAQAKCKYLVVGSGQSYERTVGRHGVVALGIAGKVVAIHVEPQDLAEQAVEVLCTPQCAAAITGRGIEIAVGSEAEPAGLVVLAFVWSMVMIGVALAGSATFGFDAT